MKKLEDIPEWAALKHAVSYLGLGGPWETQKKANKALADAEKALTAALPTSFAIGPGNTYQQAWDAVLAGHQIRQPDWPTDMSWVFERNHQELLRVYGDTHEDWTRTGAIVLPTGSHQLFENWEVLPIIDFEAPIC